MAGTPAVAAPIPQISPEWERQYHEEWARCVRSEAEVAQNPLSHLDQALREQYRPDAVVNLANRQFRLRAGPGVPDNRMYGIVTSRTFTLTAEFCEMWGQIAVAHEANVMNAPQPTPKKFEVSHAKPHALATRQSAESEGGLSFWDEAANFPPDAYEDRIRAWANVFAVYNPTDFVHTVGADVA